MKKPSEWTANEAWAQSAAVHLGANKITPFPPDPVERVSDETVEAYAACSSDSITKALAVEVLERRAKDKQK